MTRERQVALCSLQFLQTPGERHSPSCAFQVRFAVKSVVAETANCLKKKKKKVGAFLFVFFVNMSYDLFKKFASLHPTIAHLLNICQEGSKCKPS